MPRGIRSGSVDAAVLDAISSVASRAAESIAKIIAKIVSAQVEAEVRKRIAKRGRRASPRRTARTEITRWVADRRARRVPNFVIDATGLYTKKKIVAKYGTDAAFEKGKPCPPLVTKGISDGAKSEVRAKPPVVRKKGKAAA